MPTLPSKLSAKNSYTHRPFIGSSMYMDFTHGNRELDQRITFSRSSNATVTGPDGTLQYAPHNLLTHSEQFDASAWFKIGGAVITSNQTIAPDGSSTADLFDNSATSPSNTYQNVTVGTNQTNTYSIYAKKHTGSTFTIRFIRTGGTAVDIRLYFNFDTETFSGPGTEGSLDSYGHESVGDGWYRIYATHTDTNSNTSTGLVIETVLGSTGKAYIWGAQLNVGSLQPYHSTTVKNLLGYTQEFDNAAWTKSNSFVQTNLFVNSAMNGAVVGTPGTVPTGWTVQSVTEIVAIGTEDGLPYVDIRYSGSGPLNGRVAPPNATASGSTEYTGSIYMRLVDGSLPGTFGIRLVGIGVLSGSFVNVSPTGAALSSQRFTTTGTTESGATSCRLDVAYASSGAYDFTIRYAGAQLVQGETAGDYTRTDSTVKAIGYTAPDGSLTANKWVENTNTGDHYIEDRVVITPTNIPLTFSVYLKDAGRSTVTVKIYDSSTANNLSCYVDLTDGSVSSIVANGTASNVSATTTHVGNGWYRVALSGIPASSNSGSLYSVRVQPFNLNTNYTGDGTSGIYIWGAQLSDSASLDPYVYNPNAAPSSTAYYGPRFDYDPVTLAPKGLLIEEQRTNLLTYSEQFDNAAWTKNNATVTANAVTAPNGTTAAYEITENTTSSDHFIYYNISPIVGVQYTLSVYAKAGTGSRNLGFRGFGLGATGTFPVFDLSNGTIAQAGSSWDSSNIEDVGGGWYRCTATLTTANAVSPNLHLIDGAAYSYTGDGTSSIYIWGAQLEEGAFATSYIPTTSAQVTRAADVASMTGDNFSNWYNADEGTVFIDFVIARQAATPGEGILDISDGTTQNSINFFYRAAGNTGSQVSSGGILQTDLSPTNIIAANQVIKLISAIAINNYATTGNGGSVQTDLSVNLPTVSQINIGYRLDSLKYINGHIRKIAYYPRRLTNSELQAITS